MRRLAFALTVLIAATASAQVYRWVDKDGKVHYSDQKPPGASADELAIQSQPSDPEAAEKAMAELKAQNQGLDEADAQRKADAADAARAKQQKQKLCDAARADLGLLMAANRYFTVDSKGERVYDSDAQLEARRAQARARVAENCG